MVPDFLKLFDSKTNGTHKLVTPRGSNSIVNSTQFKKSARKWKTDLKGSKVQNFVNLDHQLQNSSIKKVSKTDSLLTAIATEWNKMNLRTHRNKIILVLLPYSRIQSSKTTLPIKLIMAELIPITRLLSPHIKLFPSHKQQKLLNTRRIQ
jgi:hypothetical protein